jgi:hypothetical protein
MVALSVHHLRVATNIVPEAPGLALSFIFDHVKLFLIGHPLQLSHNDQTDDPAVLGFKQFMAERRLLLDIRSQNGALTVTVSNTDLEVTAHADSFNVFIDLVRHIV